MLRLDNLSPEKRLYALQTLPAHLTEAGQGERLRELLTTFHFLQAKVAELGPEALILDYELSSTPRLLSSIEGVERLKQIQGAIRLSAHILAEDAGLLAGQLWGRLSDAWSPEIRGLLDQARKVKATPWLRPLNPSLRHPTDQLVRTLAGHTDEVRAVVLTPDGRRAISASADHTLKVWDLETGEEIHTLRGHSGTVDAVAVFPDGKRAISAASDQTLKLWDLQAGVELLSLTDTTPAHGLVVSPDGRFVISAGADWMLKVWDVERASSAKRPTRRGPQRQSAGYHS